MATCSFIKERKQTAGSMGRVIQYVSQPKKTVDEEGNRYLTGVNCVADVAMQSFMATKRLYGKDNGTFFYQYTQSFSPEENLTPAQAHEIGIELAEQYFPGCEVLVATHVDREHLHSHLVVNSVHPETGKKLHFTPKTLEQMRKVSDQICMEHGLSTLQPYQQDHQTKGLKAGEYRAAMRGESWKFQLITTVEAVMRRAGSREAFIREMNRRGYQVRWEENRKYITYTTPSGMKCRDDKLHELKFRKERMEHEFRIRNQTAKQHLEHPQTTDGSTCPHRPETQYPVHDAGADGGATGSSPAAHPGPSGGYPVIHDGIGNQGEPGAAGYGGTAPSVAGADTGLQSGNLPGYGGHPLPDEGGTETGWEEERRVYQGTLSDPDSLSEEYPGGDLLTPQMDSHYHHEFSSGSSAGMYPDMEGADLTNQVLRLLSRLEGGGDDDIMDATTRHGHGDRKALAKEQRKKIAMGHKEDDHEDSQQMV